MARLSIVCVFALCLLYLGSAQGKEGVGAGEQEWAHAEVRPGAHMFWWLYYTTDKRASSYYEKPLVIWLQGGPGASSTGYGNFEELGAYDVNLNPRNYTWVKDYNVLFIDNPVGTGFSYVDKWSSLTRNNAQIASDLLECMRAFYKKLPEFRKVPVYVMSESYGGKMTAEFALVWYKAQKAGSIESNLKGVGLGDSWISPIDSVLTWAPFLLQTGMVDTEGYHTIQAAANRTRDAVLKGEWLKATNLWAYTESVIERQAIFVDFYNILSKKRVIESRNLRLRSPMERSRAIMQESEEDDISLDRLMNTIVKEKLNVSRIWGSQSGEVFRELNEDFMKPVTDVVDRLLDETSLRVFVYTGQLDLIVDTPGTLLWVENLKSNHAKLWKSAPRLPLISDGIIEGYKKKSGNFGFYWVNRAGHMVPADNPAATAVILEELMA